MRSRVVWLPSGVRRPPERDEPTTPDEGPAAAGVALDGMTGAGSAAPRHARGRRRRAVVLPAAAGVLAALLVLTGGYATYSYNRFVGGVTHIDAIPASGGDSTDDDVDGVAQNILLVGDDHRPDNATPEELALLSTESDGGATNTDTMIVLHIPADGSSATLISMPRDSYVEIPGYGENKLNAAYSLGKEAGGSDAAGAQLLIQTVQNLTGLTMDHYVRVSLIGFYRVVDALGPVEVCLNQAAVDSFSGVDLPAGVSTLDAKQSLSFVRQRHGLPGGDLDRQVRQQYFLSVEARKILSAGTLLNPTKLGSVLDAVSSSMETDSGLNFLQLANQVKNLRPENVRSATIPVLGTPTIYVGGSALSIVEVDKGAMPAFIQSLVGPPQAYTDAVAADPAGVQVTVSNASGVTGAATTATEALAAAGFATGAPTSGAATAATVVNYPAGQEAQAKAVAAYLPGAVAVASSQVTGVTVVLGSDGVAVQAPAASAAPSATPDATESPEAPAATEAAPSPTSTPAGTSYAAGACIN
ncbi:LytTR family transcriptional regulator [Frigoribacterium faeni]|uniref:LytTR family transcriptional regulator n=1 Tax=Frigoribacterium faeni TaxID=145483 RepID=A0ABQ0USL7_9MICO|nr:LytTR family transcriptional regulator [Frigoribacterium faeni]